MSHKYKEIKSLNWSRNVTDINQTTLGYILENNNKPTKLIAIKYTLNIA